jgi:spermidine synthase
MMTHVPIFAHGRAREVLIVGGGDCGIAEEVLKDKAVKRVTQVETTPGGRVLEGHFPSSRGQSSATRALIWSSTMA